MTFRGATSAGKVKMSVQADKGPMYMAGLLTKTAGCRAAGMALANSAAGLANRDFAMPEDGMFHIVPKGKFKQADGKAVLLDEMGLWQMIEAMQNDGTQNGNAGMLVDFDHGSADSERSSEAAGWVKSMVLRPDGLYGRIDWSAKGREKVSTGAYRYASPLLDMTGAQQLADGSFRPVRLKSVALTNTPQYFGMNVLSGYPDSNKSPDCAVREEDTRTAYDYRDLLCKLLGLKPGATDVALEEAFCRVRPGTKVGTGVDRSAQGFRRSLVDLLGMDGADASWQDLVEGVADGVIAPPPAVLHNRVPAQSRVVEAIRNRTGMPFERAFDLARLKRPALFAR